MSTTITQPLPGATLPTYTETQGIKPFDWHAFLAQSTHHADEWHLAVGLAGKWVTCACGNQCAALDRLPNGEPADYMLAEYGNQFAFQILNRKVEAAKQVLVLIEERSALLLTTQAALAGKECNACGGLGCPTCHGGASGKGQAHA